MALAEQPHQHADHDALWAAERRYAPRLLAWQPNGDGAADVLAELRALGQTPAEAARLRDLGGGLALRLSRLPAATADWLAAAARRHGGEAAVATGGSGGDGNGECGLLLLATRHGLAALLDELAAVAEPVAPPWLAGLLAATLERFGRTVYTLAFPSATAPALTLHLGRPAVMGVVNVTPDSFSDGGRHFAPDAAVAHALSLVEQGAALLDIGGESTRPGAEPVTVAEEARRVVPVIAALAQRTTVPISVDTQKPEVARQALDAGALLLNDVGGFRDPGMIALVAERHVPVCCMHMQGEPRTMQREPRYADVVAEVAAFFRERTQALVAAGLPRDQVLLDPGFGFGKTLQHNLELLRRLREFASLGQPLLVGLSRKSSLAALSDETPPPAAGDRLPESLAAHVLAAARGALVVRVHDVRETRKALQVLRALAAE